MRRTCLILIACAWAIASAETRIRGEEIKAVDGHPFECDFKAIYKQKAAAVRPKDAEGHYQLALWCEKNGFKGEMNTELQRALAANSNHEGANVKLGKVLYKGSWVQPEDKKWLESREFSRYVDDEKSFTTHAVADFERQLQQLTMLNQLKPTKEQLKEMWPVLNAAEAERLVLRAETEKIVTEVEAAWTALRNEALKGVVDSFDQNAAVERRARNASFKWKDAPPAMWSKLYEDFGNQFMATLTPEQKRELLAKFGGRGGRKGSPGREIRGTQAGVDFLEKVRALTEDDFNAKKADLAAEALNKFGKGPQTLLGKQEQGTGKRSAEDIESEKTTVMWIMQRARVEDFLNWERRKFSYAAQIEARNQEERLKTIMATGQKKNPAPAKAEKTGNLEAKIAATLFDGSLREVVGLKLGMTAHQMAVKPSSGAKVGPDSTEGSHRPQIK